MRFLPVYFQRRIVRDTFVYVYSSAQRFTASVDLQGAKSNFSVTYYDSSQPTTSSPSKGSGSVTMWLNDVNDEEALLYKEVYGSEAYLAVSEDGSMQLISKQDFNADTANLQHVVTPQHLQTTIQA